MRNIAGKQAMVTGAAGGIGRAIALELARWKVNLWLVDIDVNGVEAVTAEVRKLGVEAIAERCDLTSDEEIGQCVGRVMERWGGVDILVNNAGLAFYGHTETMTPEHWKRIMAVNLFAPIELIRLLQPVMRSRGRGHVVNICSIMGLVPHRKATAYQTSKYAMVGLSQTLRAEWMGTGVSASAVCPGFVRNTGLFTSMNLDPKARTKTLPPSFLCCTAEQVARATVHAIRWNRGTVVVGILAKFWWGCQRLSPGLVDLAMRLGWDMKVRPPKHAGRSAGQASGSGREANPSSPATPPTPSRN